MIIRYHRRFLKELSKRSIKIQDRFRERELLWRTDPQDPLLDDHALGHEYAGHRSFNVSGDLRAIYRTESDGVVVFVRFGTHHELYGT